MGEPEYFSNYGRIGDHGFPRPPRSLLPLNHVAWIKVFINSAGAIVGGSFFPCVAHDDGVYYDDLHKTGAARPGGRTG